MGYVELLTSRDRPEIANRESDSGRADLGRDEWWVVELARKDGLWSLNPDGLPQRLARALFGIRPPRPFADPRLEALRRFAVVAWNRGKVGVAHMREFVAAGFSCSDAKAVLEHITRRRKLPSWPQGLA